MNAEVIETERFILKPVNITDLGSLTEIWGNPKVMQNIYGGKTLSEAESQAKHESFLKHWKKHGFGCWTMQHKSTHERLGYLVFRYFESDLPQLDGKIELG